MSVRSLIVRMHGVDVGRVSRDDHGRTLLRYDDEWRSSDGAFPLSLSLPLSAAEHRKEAEAYLWGLLPDNEMILDAWATRFQTSARNAIGLLAHVGTDCPGAVQLLTEEAAARSPRDSVEWLSESAIAARLRRLRDDTSAWREVDDEGQFSLGGAQAKTALLEENGRWGLPSGRTPTTHIFKPGMRELRGHAENEHFCLLLARELGLPAAASAIAHFEDETAIIVERYDRARTASGVVRIHQEDFCQATATMPSRKYQNEGGPSPSTIVDLLNTHSTSAREDVVTFVEALVFGWVIVATDGHAKNYSLLHAPRRVRLAPLYDIASILPYAPNLRKVKLAMSIGGKYRVNEIGMRQWRRFGEEIGLGADSVRDVVARFTARLPDVADAVRKSARRDGVRHAVIGTLADAFAKRARAIAATL